MLVFLFWDKGGRAAGPGNQTQGDVNRDGINKDLGKQPGPNPSNTAALNRSSLDLINNDRVAVY